MRSLGAAGLVAVALCLVAAQGAAPAVRAASPPQNAALPSITGTARQGQTLTASSGSWGGTTPITYAYEWQRCDKSGASCSAISASGSATYQLAAADVGHTVRVKVTATNGAGTANALSAPAGPVASLGNAPAQTRQPNPSGTAQEGKTITVGNGSWSGTRPLTFSYQWQRCTAVNPTCTNITGATGRSYTLVAADVGSKLRAVVTATNAVGSGSVFSNLTAVVLAKGTPPTNTAAPVIIGAAAVGKLIATSNGQWSGADPNGFSIRWLRCDPTGASCNPIGTFGTTYTVQQADNGQTLRSEVTASNAFGSAKATSNAVLVGATAAEGGAGSGTISLSGGLVSVPVSSLTPHPDRLVIANVGFTPSPMRKPGGTIVARVRVMNAGTNQVVRGALVAVVGIPYSWVVPTAEVATGTDGWATIAIRTTRRLPHQGALVMQIRARGTGTSAEAILAGISTRRLVQLPLR
jgi:hypothetical protein